MKTLEINAFYCYGSTGDIVKTLLMKQKNENIDAYAVYWHYPPITHQDNNVFYIGRHKPFSLIIAAICYILFGGSIHNNVALTQRLIKKIEIIHPDLINIHNLHGSFNLDSIDIPMLFTFLDTLEIPIIWTFHDMWPITGRCFHFEFKKCNKWQIICNNCPQRFYDHEGVLFDYSRYNYIIKKRLFTSIKNLHIVAISKWVEDNIAKSFLRERNVRQIYNGIDISIFQECNRSLTRSELKIDNKFAILVMGWSNHKGSNNYVELAKKLDTDEIIIILGDIPFFIKQKWRKIKKKVIYIPAIQEKYRLAQIYSSCDVYYNTSYAETFGLTTVESLACGTPVIGYNTTATPELIGPEGVCGFTVPRGDISLVYDKIRVIKKLGRVAYSKMCSERVKTFFNINDSMKNQIAFYRELIKQFKLTQSK